MTRRLGSRLVCCGLWVSEHGAAMGRPVGVAIDRDNGLLVADDIGNTVWRVSARSGGDS